MPSRLFPFIVLLLLCSNKIYAQQTTVYTEANIAFKHGTELYEKGIFVPARQEFERAANLLRPVNEAEWRSLKRQAQFGAAKSAVRMGSPEGEKLILEFIRNYAPDPAANEAVVEMANYYFTTGDYKKAQSFFDMVDARALGSDQRAEVKFKEGYAFFVQKNFAKAKDAFASIKDVQGEYYEPANYYYGLTQFFNNKFDDALKSFKIVENSVQYKAVVPYYTGQILFAQNKFDEVIKYLEPKTQNKTIKNLAEINQLVGQSYFEKKDFAKALPFLEEYAATASSNMREEDHYQVGFVLYKAGRYKDAIPYFEEAGKGETKLSQNALYHVGDCYLRVGNRTNARNAFGGASRAAFDKNLQEEALFNYGKLSYELKYDREATSALETFQPSSTYYNEAQSILSNLFTNTRDYEKAITTLEAMPTKSPKMMETYQKVSYYRGVQLYQAGDVDKAANYFRKALENPYDARTKALCYYWLGEIAHNNHDYNNSIANLNQFFTLSKTLSRMPDEANVHTANYLQGYNYLKQKNFTTALTFFQETVAGLKQNKAYISNTAVTQNILGDAILRAGDCLFKKNKYDDASKFYNEAVNNKYTGYVYALYQKAIIEGLRGQKTDKLIALEKIVQDFPRSEYADDALFELGDTYVDINKNDQAMQALKRLVSEYKQSPLINKTYLKLGLIAYNQGSTDEAIGFYKKVFENNPDNQEKKSALAALQEIYVKDLGKPDEFIEIAEKVPGGKVDVSTATRDSITFQSAETQFENGNYDRATQGYTQYIAKFPNGSSALRAYFNRAESYFQLKNYTAAMKDYETVVTRGQSKYTAKSLEKAAFLAEKEVKDYQKAFGFFSQLEKAATTDAQRLDAQLGMMRSAYRTKNTDAVIQMGDKISANAAATKEQKAAAQFYAGKMSFDKKDYDRALTSFNQVIRLSNNEQTAEARYLNSYIYYMRRDLAVAMKMAEASSQENGSFPYWVAKSVMLQADIYSEKGDLSNARLTLEALLDNYDEDKDIVNEAKAKLEALKKKDAANKPSKANSDKLEMDNN
jgi:tetratricopeptide (TPR) repeat protein